MRPKNVQEAIQQGIDDSLTTVDAHWLPEEFTINLPADAYKLLLSQVVSVKTGKALSAKTPRILLTIHSFQITVQPEPAGSLVQRVTKLLEDPKIEQILKETLH